MTRQNPSARQTRATLSSRGAPTTASKIQFKGKVAAVIKVSPGDEIKGLVQLCAWNSYI